MNIILTKREMNYGNKLRVSCEHNLWAMLVLVGEKTLLMRTAQETSHLSTQRFYTDLTGTGAVEEKESAGNWMKSFSSKQHIRSG